MSDSSNFQGPLVVSVAETVTVIDGMNGNVLDTIYERSGYGTCWVDAPLDYDGNRMFITTGQWDTLKLWKFNPQEACTRPNRKIEAEESFKSRVYKAHEEYPDDARTPFRRYRGDGSHPHEYTAFAGTENDEESDEDLSTMFNIIGCLCSRKTRFVAGNYDGSLCSFQLPDDVYDKNNSHSKPEPLIQIQESSEKEHHRDYVRDVLFIDDEYFASCADDKLIKVWNWKSSVHPFLEIKEHNGWIYRLQYSEQKQCLFSCGKNAKIILHDMKDKGKQICSFSNPLKSTFIMSLYYVEDKNLIIGGDNKGNIISFDIRKNFSFCGKDFDRSDYMKIVMLDIGPLKQIKYCGKSEMIVVGGGEGVVAFLDTEELLSGSSDNETIAANSEEMKRIVKHSITQIGSVLDLDVTSDEKNRRENELVRQDLLERVIFLKERIFEDGEIDEDVFGGKVKVKMKKVLVVGKKMTILETFLVMK